ncbi:hypothetical protein D9M69_717310 [compost metagenome]
MGGDEGHRWVEANVTTPGRFLQFSQGQVNVRTTVGGGTTTRTSYIPVSSLTDFLGLEHWKAWAARLDSLVLDEDQCRTLALVKEALAQSEQSVTAEE